MVQLMELPACVRACDANLSYALFISCGPALGMILYERDSLFFPA